jgi:hypothetical protein
MDIDRGRLNNIAKESDDSKEEKERNHNAEQTTE